MVPVNRTVGAVGRTAEEGQQAPVGHAVKPDGDQLDDRQRAVAGRIRLDRLL